MNGEVLFFDFAFREFLPIIHEAVRRGMRPIMNQPPMRQILLQEGIAARAYLEFMDSGDSEYASRQARALAERFSASVTAEGAAGAFDVEDGNLLVSGGGTLVRQILSTVENQLLVARITRRLIEMTDLKAVVMRSCMSAGQRVIQEIAMARGIPVIELSHGNPPRSSELAGPLNTWHMAVLGSREKEILVGRGADPDRIHLTGGPQFDPLYEDAVRVSKAEARARLDLPMDRPFVVFAGSFNSGRTLHFADDGLNLLWSNDLFVEALSRMDPVPLVAVRPHPGEARQQPARMPTQAELQDYQRWFAERGIRLMHVDYDSASLVKEKALLLRAADAVVVQATSSTLITETLILDRPVFKFDYPSGATPSFYEDEDGVITVPDANQLSEQLDRILHDPAFLKSRLEEARQALPSLNHGNDGKAALRVVDLVESLGSSRAA